MTAEKLEQIVCDSIKHHLQMALDFNSPFAKVALKAIGADVVVKAMLEGWKPDA